VRGDCGGSVNCLCCNFVLGVPMVLHMGGNLCLWVLAVWCCVSFYLLFNCLVVDVCVLFVSCLALIFAVVFVISCVAVVGCVPPPLL